jgi:hypothetical protein
MTPILSHPDKTRPLRPGSRGSRSVWAGCNRRRIAEALSDHGNLPTNLERLADLHQRGQLTGTYVGP